LDCAVAVEAALQLFGQRCLAHLLRNEPVILAGEPEGIHQMRVAVRRLRSVLSALKPLLPLEHRRWTSGELKWLTHALSPARNWDIFATSLVRPVTDALSVSPNLEDLVSAVEQRRHTAFDAAKQAILSERFTKLRWFEGRGWREQPVSARSALLLAPIANIA